MCTRAASRRSKSSTSPQLREATRRPWRRRPTRPRRKPCLIWRRRKPWRFLWQVRSAPMSMQQPWRSPAGSTQRWATTRTRRTRTSWGAYKTSSGDSSHRSAASSSDSTSSCYQRDSATVIVSVSKEGREEKGNNHQKGDTCLMWE